MLQRGCSHREIANTLHVSVGSVYNIRKVHVFDANRLRGGKPQKLNRAYEQRCMLEVVRGRMGTCANVARSAQQVLGMRVALILSNVHFIELVYVCKQRSRNHIFLSKM